MLQKRLRTPSPRRVSRVGAEAPSDLPIARLWRHVERMYRTGLYPAIGLTIRHRGAVVMDRTLGHLEHHPGEAPREVVTPDTLFNLFSASKILTATVVHALAEDGALDLDERVDTYLPGFGRHGKEEIRLHHLLSHTAGIPHMPGGLDVEAALAAGRVALEPIFELKPVSAPGETHAYHPMTSWLLLAEIVEQVTGQDLRRVAHERILDPLGFRRMNYGVEPHEVPAVARHAFTGPPSPAFMTRIFRQTIGVDPDVAVAISNREDFLTAVLPSANVISTGREATRFLQLLLNGGTLDGVRVLEARSVQRMVSEATPARFDGTFGFPIRYGTGVMMGGNKFSLFGLGTRGAYGHLGFSNVLVYADPRRELAVSFLNTGKPMMAPGMLMWLRVVLEIARAVPRAA